jgi:Terminase RNaseH-like domain
VAGEDDDLANLPDDGALARTGRRDSTALTVVEVVTESGSRGAPTGGTHREPTAVGGGSGRGQSGSDGCSTRLSDYPTTRLPSYRVVDRRLWTGARHADLHATIVDLARNVWRARRVVVDATGIGAGLASWLTAALPGLVVPWVFTAHAKSDLGWRLLAAIDGGRLKDYADDGADETRLFWRQVEACAYEVRPGPGKLLAWGVEDARTHDDLLLSLALVGALDDVDWRPRVARGTDG